MTSLTGDPTTDRLVPAASRLVCALRHRDPEEVAAAFTDAAAAAPAGHDPLVAFATVLAAMVPWDETPGDLLWWCRREEYERLLQAGLSPDEAATVIERASPRHRAGR